jgi:hypothetical protein
MELENSFTTTSLTNGTVVIPTQTIVGGTHNIPQPNICPGCGKCNSCGRPHETQNPWPYAPYTQPQWTVYNGGITGSDQSGLASFCGLSGNSTGLTGDSGLTLALNEVDA